MIKVTYSYTDETEFPISMTKNGTKVTYLSDQYGRVSYIYSGDYIDISNIKYELLPPEIEKYAKHIGGITKSEVFVIINSKGASIFSEEYNDSK